MENNPEYPSFRCCMCPNINRNSVICPGIPGTPHPDASQCRFVKKYIGFGNRKFKVMQNSRGWFKTYFLNPNNSSSDGWKPLAATKPQSTFDKAQADLNHLAKQHGWTEWDENKGGIYI